MRKDENGKIALFGILVLFVALTVPAVSAGVDVYFSPDPASIPGGPPNTVTVQILMDSAPGDTVDCWGTWIKFDPTCVNITNCEYKSITGNTIWVHEGDRIKLWNFKLGCLQYPNGTTLVNLTVQCENSSYCESPLEFIDNAVPPDQFVACIFDERTTTWHNGTVLQGTPPQELMIPTYSFDGDDNPIAYPNVTFTNLDESKGVKNRLADYSGHDGYANITLDVPTEVEAGDVLEITACEDLGDYESNCNVSTHTVTDDELNAGVTANVNLTLNHYCLNYYPSFPFHTWKETNWSGPAAVEMLIDNYRNTSDVPSQTVLNETGLGYNQICNADIPFVDPLGLKSTLNLYLHAYGELPYVANYGIGSYDTIEDVLHYICKWQYLGPGAAPAYGNYTNWMVIRGIHTNRTPSFTQDSYEIYGFWINDPYNATLEGPGGIGENTYKSVDQWSSIYHKKLNKSGVNVSDDYYDKYVAVCEPPEDDDVVVTLAHAKPRFASIVTPELAEKSLMVYGIKQMALEKVVRDNERLKIVQAAIDGVTEELVPFDTEFADAFVKTIPGNPKFVSSDIGDYYIVPFNVPVNMRLPVKIQRDDVERPKASDLKKFGRMKRLDDRPIIRPIPIEPIRVERTLVVVLVNAEDGSFMEASWVKEPVKYLPVSETETLKLALGKVDLTSARAVRFEFSSKPMIELVYSGKSPYYPDWKITVDGVVFFVGQDGSMS